MSFCTGNCCMAIRPPARERETADRTRTIEVRSSVP